MQRRDSTSLLKEGNNTMSLFGAARREEANPQPAWSRKKNTKKTEVKFG